MSNQNTGKQAMISLISEQAMPNLMAPLLLDPRPSKLMFVLPRDREAPRKPDRGFKRIYDGIKVAFGFLEEDSPEKIALRVRNRGPVSPYDFLEVKATCRKVRKELTSQGYEVLYNVTGGTKLMAQAALEDAREGGCRAVYVDTEFRKLVQVEPTTDRSDFAEEGLRPIDVPHYLAAYALGRKRAQGRRRVPEAYKVAAKLLVRRPRSSPSVLHLMLQDNPGKGGTFERSLADLAPGARELLEEVCGMLVAAGAKTSIAGDTLEGTANGDLYDFWWDRRWLEWYVFGVLEELNSAPSRQPFYNPPWCDVRFWWDTKDATREVNYTVTGDDETGETEEIKLPLNELDVVAVRGGRLLLCECKTGANALKSGHFYKLHVLGRRLGTFADMVFITDVKGLGDSTCHDDTVKRQALRALTLDVLPVGLEELADLGEILEEPDRKLRERKVRFGLG